MFSMQHVGPNVVQWFVNRRFSGLENRDLLAEYTYQLSAAKGSGEYALTSLLYPGGHARSPLRDRLDSLRVPTTFVVRCSYLATLSGDFITVVSITARFYCEGVFFVFCHVRGIRANLFILSWMTRKKPVAGKLDSLPIPIAFAVVFSY